MDEPKPADPGAKPSGPCNCKELDRRGIPEETQPFRELLDALSARVKDLAKEPTEATNKFPDELKDVEKEYQGIDAIVAKYKDFYDKQLDCKLADVKRWRESIEKWSTIDEPTKKAIKKYRDEKYNEREKTICCQTLLWLRRRLHFSSDCLVQARNNETQRQEAYDQLKGFLDAITKVFTDLEALFKKAEAFNKEQKPKSVYAVSLEFDDLQKLLDWPKTDEERCSGPVSTTPAPSGYGQQSQGSAYEGKTEGYAGSGESEVKKKLSPAELRRRLIHALRELLLAKFHRFLLHHDLLKTTADFEAAKKECEKFRADRQKLFLEVVEDIPTGKGGGTGTVGGSQPQPSGGGYKPPQPPQPPSGGYEKK